VFPQLSWKKSGFLDVASETFATDTYSFCSLETWYGIGEETMLQSFNFIFSILSTLLIKRQINEFEDTYEEEFGSRTRNPAKRAGGFARMDVWQFAFMVPYTTALLL